MAIRRAGAHSQIEPQFDAIVVGAGFAGLYMLHKLRGLGITVRVYEMGADVGGTWYWNGYPGARCDIESLIYSYSFSHEIEQEWEWSERYAAQPEIQRYLAYVADRLDLRRDISFNTRVIGGCFDAETNDWTVEFDNGTSARARFLITAVGCHSMHNVPSIAGLERFKGRLLHTARWTHGKVDFAGQKVGVIGTGSSGVQVITQVAKEADHLTVFQRTPNFSLPARNRALAPEEVARIKRDYAQIRALTRKGLLFGGGDMLLTAQERTPAATHTFDVSESVRNEAFEVSWSRGGIAPMVSTFGDLLIDDQANEAASEFIRGKIRSIVKNPKVAEKLCPKGYPLGAKRICLDTGYYETFNRFNVTLVDLTEDPIADISTSGVRLRSGRLEALDTLILATGFDAVTGSILRLNLTGARGKRLTHHWAEGPSTYLGMGISGFPNLFTITGPLSPSAASTMTVSIEQHVDWISDCLAYLRDKGLDRIEADPKAEQEWRDLVVKEAEGTFLTRTNSWYVGANIPGKPRAILVYTGGVGRYREICDEVAAEGYRGFTLSKANGAN